MNFIPNKISFLNLAHNLRLCTCEGFHTSRHLSEKNHYEVLNLQKNCTPKEIRESFIELAKKHHPDANRDDPGSHKRFVQLQSAYSTLSVPLKRQQYDLTLSSGHNPYATYPRRNDPEYYREFGEEFREMYYRSRRTPTGPVPQAGNFQILVLFVAFTIVGAALQYIVIKWLYRRNHDDEMQRHERASASYMAVKQEMDKRAEDYDLRKLRAAYFKEMGHGPIGLHLVPSLIRPQLPDGNAVPENAHKDVTRETQSSKGTQKE